MSTHSEQILRDHITNILDEYVLTHLTEGVDHKESQDRHVVQVLMRLFLGVGSESMPRFECACD